MSFEDCIRFASENPVAYIATMDNDQPRVRAFLMWFADESGFYFQTGSIKETVGQLKENPKIEVCFFNNKAEEGKMMRVTGKAGSYCKCCGT